MDHQYLLLDSGNEQKLEQFGPYRIVRPCSQAMWLPALPRQSWEDVDAIFTRDEKKGWTQRKKLPKEWVVQIEGIRFKIAPTDFGHVGVFPEHSLLWKEMKRALSTRKNPQVLNLFAYSGGATLAAAQAGAKVCHLDASKGMVAWARENAVLNQLENAPIRWIVDDVIKFLNREVKRGNRYDGIILDPPSFGRGNQGEVFKIERDIHPILSMCKQLLSDDPLFVLLSSHTPGMTPIVMGHLMEQMMKSQSNIQTGEMIIPSHEGKDLPCGSYARWNSVR